MQKASWFARQGDEARASIGRKRPRHPLSEDAKRELQARVERFTELHAIASAYEADCDRTKEVSGYIDAIARQAAAFNALASLIGSIMAVPSETMTGVIVKAQALEAWNADPLGKVHHEGWAWPGLFAAEVIRLASANA